MGLDSDQEDQYIQDEGGVAQPSTGMKSIRLVPKRVQDREPRANNLVGEAEKGEKIADLTVVIRKKKDKNNDKSLDVEYQVLRQEPEVEVGGDWPEEHVA